MAEKIIGKYKVLEEVGRGGMGIVYKGVHESLGHTVAVKTLPPQFSTDETALNRFMREAKILAKLRHPNIVYIFDIEEQDSSHYLIMEFINGKSVSQILKEQGPFSAAEADRIVGDVAMALAHAHEKGIIHRDIKPENIMVTDEGVVKVTDFGIARGMEGPSLTRTGIIGTPSYMSPEHITSGKNIDGRSDIYALGIVFFEMLTGSVPFSGDSEYAVLEQHLRKPPPLPSDITATVPESCNSVFLKCVEKERDSRYQSARDVSESLKQIDLSAAPTPPPVYDGPTVVVQDIPPAEVPANDSPANTETHTQAPSSPTQPASGPISNKLSGNKKPIFAGVLVVAALLLLGIVVLRETGRDLQEPHGIPAVQPDGRTAESASAYTADRHTDLSLRPLHTRRQELKSKFSRQRGAVDERLLRGLLRIKTGVTGSSHVSPDIRKAVNMVLDVSDLVSRVETGDCDVLLTLAEQDSTVIIKIDDTVYENASNSSSRIILPTIDTDRLKTQLTAMI
ncbi:MAG: serine/threonine protein kinase, partial [Deltaproteobacteria bacterium]|nr:serine/threonine protein kinase [Deltaproteobacteria bacterium]